MKKFFCCLYLSTVALSFGGVNNPGGGTGEPLITAGTTGQYWRGDKTFQTLNSAAVGSTATGGNIFTLANPGVSAIPHIAADNTVGIFSIANSFTAGDMLYATGSNAIGALLAVGTGSVLKSAGAAALPVWGTIASSFLSDASNIPLLNVANTFTGSNLMTLGGNLTVSGGTITGGAAGLSLAGGGTNQNITLTPSGTGVFNFNTATNAAYNFTSSDTTIGSGASIVLKNDAAVTSFFKQYSSTAGSIGLENNGAFGATNNIILIADVGVASAGTKTIQFRTGGYNNTQERARITTTKLDLGAPVLFGWGSNTTPNDTLDIGLARNAAGILEVNNGTAGTFAGLKVSTFTASGTTAAAVNLGDGTVTQATSTTTGVTMNAASGVITTFTEAGAAVTDAAFVLTDSAIGSGSVVQATIDNYAGTIITNGIPHVWVSGIAAGSCTVHVTNVHAANALNGVVKIGISVN